MKKLFLIFTICLSLLGCSVAPEKPITKELSSGYAYNFFYVEGMPCMHIAMGNKDAASWSYGGVTCDWSKWNGNSK